MYQYLEPKRYKKKFQVSTMTVLDCCISIHIAAWEYASVHATIDNTR